MINKKHLPSPDWRPPFVVPAELTANIPHRSDEPLPKLPRKHSKARGPAPTYTKEESRRRHLKLLLRERHSHKLDSYIARLEERLIILKEIRDELIKS
jgi:hypothetical protein